MAHESARQLYGSTSKSSCVPGASSARRSHASPGVALAHTASKKKSLNSLCGQYLADVLTVWDCYERAPRSDYPLLLRFENNDYVAASHNRELVIEPQAGDICFRAPEHGSMGTVGASRSAHSRPQDDSLVWLPAREFSSALGQQVINAFVDAQNATVIVLEDCYLRLKPQGPTVDVFLSRY